MATRRATHAGSWYESSRARLNLSLDAFLNRVPDELVGIGNDPGEAVTVPVPGARAIIAPHAGYSYSGQAAAWAYKSLDWSKAERIFLLGPSHHVHLRDCALSQCSQYDTPLGPLLLDLDTIGELRATGHFSDMSLKTDEGEHSMEMHLPYIFKMLSRSHGTSKPFPPIIPILVGSTSEATERHFGTILAPYLADESNFFVISTDFCHWGTRFDYLYYQPSNGPARQLKPNDPPPTLPHIHESILHIDRLSWEAIETGSHDAFLETLAETKNTVCGRHPIGVMMAAIEEAKAAGDVAEEDGFFRFVRHERSSLVQTLSDSSVSYGSAYAIF